MLTVEFTRTRRKIVDNSTGARMEQIGFIRGDTERIDFTLKTNGVAEDLTMATGATVRLVHRDSGTSIVKVATLDTDRTTGKGIADFTSAETAAMELGTYRGQVVVAYPEDVQHTWPDADGGDHFLLNVTPGNPAS